MFTLENYKNFNGKIDQLVHELNVCMDELDIKKDKLNISRTVRYYINEKVLPPAERDGRDFTYNYEHIIKFLYLRKQLNDGWPFFKIKENTQYQDLSYFEEYFDTIDKDEALDNSMKVVRELKETSYNKSENFISESRRPASVRFNPYVAQEQTGIPNLNEALRDINSDLVNVLKQDFTTLQLSTSLVLLIEKNMLANMKYDLAKKIGNAISAALFHKNPITISDRSQIHMGHQNVTNLLDQIQKLKKEIEDLKMNKHEADLIRSEKSFSSKVMFRDLIEKLKLENDKFLETLIKHERNKQEKVNHLKHLLTEIQAGEPKIIEDKLQEVIKFFDKESSQSENDFKAIEYRGRSIERMNERIMRLLSKIKD